jgi:hypothetical protein
MDLMANRANSLYFQPPPTFIKYVDDVRLASIITSFSVTPYINSKKAA